VLLYQQRLRRMMYIWHTGAHSITQVENSVIGVRKQTYETSVLFEVHYSFVILIHSKPFRKQNYSKSIKANLNKSVITEQQSAAVREWGGKGSAGFSIGLTERGKIFCSFGYVKNVDHTEGER